MSVEIEGEGFSDCQNGIPRRGGAVGIQHDGLAVRRAVDPRLQSRPAHAPLTAHRHIRIGHGKRIDIFVGLLRLGARDLNAAARISFGRSRRDRDRFAGFRRRLVRGEGPADRIFDGDGKRLIRVGHLGGHVQVSVFKHLFAVGGGPHGAVDQGTRIDPGFAGFPVALIYINGDGEAARNFGFDEVMLDPLRHTRLGILHDVYRQGVAFPVGDFRVLVGSKKRKPNARRIDGLAAGADRAERQFVERTENTRYAGPGDGYRILRRNQRERSASFSSRLKSPDLGLFLGRSGRSGGKIRFRSRQNPHRRQAEQHAEHKGRCQPFSCFHG